LRLRHIVGCVDMRTSVAGAFFWAIGATAAAMIVVGWAWGFVANVLN